MSGAVANEPSRSVVAPVRRVFRAVVVTVVPGANQLDERGWLALEELEDTLATRQPALRRQLQLFLRAIDWLPLLRYARTFLPSRISNAGAFSAIWRIIASSASAAASGDCARWRFWVFTDE